MQNNLLNNIFKNNLYLYIYKQNNLLNYIFKKISFLYFSDFSLIFNLKSV